ncbi:MAG: phosphoadenosine phosphosulfate reductase family protein [Boseongicola sp. SB0677_bin_26]|nr:phosphoadenosine phosphosulfate reductase family protein [Boseongicola sp. SB0665_bin_10]MYG26852.1 phosphoadenosine phosphosulfate reductase family protein [Boseongicola sp. SB0677_bin_26]
MFRAGALVSNSTSGGKDSQAMTILLSRIVPRDQLVAVHAPLEGVEWPGMIEHVRATLPADVPLILAHVTSGKTLLESIEDRGQFPSPAVRWCTSSTKRGPIEWGLRHYLKAHPRFGGRIVSALGMRAKESPARARKPVWRLNERNSRAGRTWFDWLSNHDLAERQVFDIIQDAGQAPHPAYAMGMSRLSCVFCIMASRADLCTAARLQPRLCADYVELERRIGHTLSPSDVPLPDLTGIPVTADAARRPRRRRDQPR